MFKGIILSIVALALVATPALANVEEDTVAINTQVFECVDEEGSVKTTVSGTATYSSSYRLLVVDADGNEILSSLDELENWETSEVEFGIGSHTVSAVITNSYNDDVRASDSWEFDIVQCEEEETDPEPEPEPETLAEPEELEDELTPILPDTGGGIGFVFAGLGIAGIGATASVVVSKLRRRITGE